MATDESAEDEPKTIKIVRDATFVRAVADQAIVYDLGRDVEFAFLQSGPVPVLRTDVGDALKFSSEAAVTEVARIRITPPGATRLAMSILKEMIDEDRVKVDEIVKTLNGWNDAARARDIATGDAIDVDVDVDE